MLKAIHLQNFKSIEDLRVPFGNLTVLTGLNGSGKSSVLQAIALLKQSLDYDQSGAHLVLRGQYLQLGYVEDVWFDGAKSDDIRLGIEIDENKLGWKCDAKAKADTLIAKLVGDISTLTNALFGFQYIQADRLTPAIQYLQASSVDRDKGSLGSRGEFTVDYLSRNADKKIPAARRYPVNRLKEAKYVELMRSVAPTDFLPDVTAAWLQLLSPGVRPIANLIELADSAALRFEYKGYSDIQRDIETHPHRPSNVGFGLTYILPIIVACLSADRGSLLLLENPEAHLHPRGQAALGLLLSLCAADGVQIIVETHSDHVLNGIRLAAKKKDILAEKVMVHYFSRTVETGISVFDTPVLQENGRFSHWPEGFFDEWGNALDELLED